MCKHCAHIRANFAHVLVPTNGFCAVHVRVLRVCKACARAREKKSRDASLKKERKVGKCSTEFTFNAFSRLVFSGRIMAFDASHRSHIYSVV